MRKELTEKLQKIQENLLNNRRLGVKRLEQLGDEAMRAFDEAIKAIDKKINVSEEIKKRREILRLWKISSLKSLFPVNFKYLLSMPFIYGMIIPSIFLHICIELYHQICFRLYGIPLVKAGEFFVYDRALLPYLNWFEKINCLYCSYVNCLFLYSVEIAGRTERYWCPIKYANRMKKTHAHYEKFFDYLDAENFRVKWKELRDYSDIIDAEEKTKDNQEEN
jgi:hypothetical protein